VVPESGVTGEAMLDEDCFGGLPWISETVIEVVGGLAGGMSQEGHAVGPAMVLRF